MTAVQFMGIGVLLGVVSGGCLIAFLMIGIVYRGRTPLYARHLRKVQFPEDFHARLQEAYQDTENIRDALGLVREQYPKGPAAKRIAAAQDYLKHSRYKDYETALYRYLSEGDTQQILGKILLADAQKMKRLSCKGSGKDIV